jgi:hypothetical protein
MIATISRSIIPTLALGFLLLAPLPLRDLKIGASGVRVVSSATD